MSAAERAVLKAEHRVQMEARLAVIALRDIADQAQTSHCSLTSMGLYFLAARSNQPTLAFENAPIAPPRRR